MLFIPLKKKYKKSQKGRCFKKINKNNTLCFGQYGLQLLSPFRITSKQLITLRNNIKKKIKKKGRVVVRAFSHISVTRKPLEVRMGKGKGSVSSWVSRLKSGTIICEISTFKKILALKVLNRVRFKFPVKTRVVIKNILF